MTKGQKVRELLGYCQRHERLDDLEAALERERPDQYEEAFPATRPVETPTKQPEVVIERKARQIFISHAHEDAELAQRLAVDLQTRGWGVWIAPNSIKPGEKWVEAINRGLSESGVFVLLLTAAAVRSRWVQSETNAAIGMEHRGVVKFLPLDVESAQAPPLWGAYQNILFRSGYQPGLKALLSQLTPEKAPVEEQTIRVTPSDDESGTQGPLVTGGEDSKGVAQTMVAEAAAGILGGAPVVKGVSQLPHDPAIKTIVWEKDGKEMVRIPAGEFLYGDDKKKVELPEFWIDKTPVTNGEYALFVTGTGYEAPSHWEGKTPPEEITNHPVTKVSWYDAIAYAEWAGKQLPTDEEWEKAARGTDGRKYPWGDQAPTKELCNFGKNVGGTTPVGDYSPRGDSPYGIVDMAGNVWEWCINKYDDPSDTAVDDSGDWRVVRGGSWLNSRGSARAASRNYDNPNLRGLNLGFRVVVRRRPSQ
jgi:formylglycine-generating enzyme required for sulfatase activity